MRMQVIGPLVAVAAIPLIIAGLYIASLRADLGAADRVIALERAGRVEWQRKYEAAEKAVVDSTAALAACTTAAPKN